jgi:hypothetical protein
MQACRVGMGSLVRRIVYSPEADYPGRFTLDTASNMLSDSICHPIDGQGRSAVDHAAIAGHRRVLEVFEEFASMLLSRFADLYSSSRDLYLGNSSGPSSNPLKHRRSVFKPSKNQLNTSSKSSENPHRSISRPFRLPQEHLEISMLLEVPSVRCIPLSSRVSTAGVGLGSHCQRIPCDSGIVGYHHMIGLADPPWRIQVCPEFGL